MLGGRTGGIAPADGGDLVIAALLLEVALAGERGVCTGDGPAVDVVQLDDAVALFGRVRCGNARGGSIEPVVEAIESGLHAGDAAAVAGARAQLWIEIACADHILDPVEAARIHLANFQLTVADEGTSGDALLYAEAAIAADALLPIPVALQTRSEPIAAVFDLAVELLRYADGWPECVSLGSRGRTAWVDGRRARGIRREFPTLVQWRRGRQIRTVYVWPDAAVAAGGR